MILFVFLLVSSVSAYEIKFMYPYTDSEKARFTNRINYINQSYFEGLDEIRIFNPDRTLFSWSGLYTNKNIYLNTNLGWVTTIMNHELAHHQQLVLGDKDNMVTHSGRFCELYWDIIKKRGFDYNKYC